MTPSTTIPLTITPEAAEHIEQLGTRAAFEQMLDYIRQHVSGLRSLDVDLSPPYDTGTEDQVIIHAFRDAAVAGPNDTAKSDWHHWVIATLPTEVYWHYTLMFAYEDDHAAG